MKFAVFTSGDSTVNEAAFNELHARIMQLKGLPSADGFTIDWSPPIAHPTYIYIAMPVDESCYPAMSQTEIDALQTREQLTAAGWFPPLDDPKPPWWGIFVWWK